MYKTRNGKKMTARIEKLREEYFAAEFGMCLERGLAVTRSYKKTEGEPTVLRRAKSFYEVLSTVPLYIRPDELLVGTRSSGLAKCTSYPEYQLDQRFEWPEEIREYWKGKNSKEIGLSLQNDVVKANEKEMCCGMVTGLQSGFGHMVVDYEKAIYKGFRAIIEEADAELQKAETQAEKDFLEAVKISGEAIIRWANRYADLCEKEAKAEGISSKRAEELKKMASVCRRVPEYPAENFYEALQSFNFVHIAIHIEQYGWSVSAGRFDQYMYPFYKKDLTDGTLTEDEAWELLLSLWMKFMENIHDGIGIKHFQNLTIGGMDQDGRDMSNELTHMIMDATAATRFIQPVLSLRWSKNIDSEIWMHAMEVIEQGLGMPALFNDDIIMAELELNGVSHEDALDYALVGCVEPAIPGKEEAMTSGGHLNLLKIMELTLFNGRSLQTGKMLGMESGDPTTFKTFDEFFEAYARQCRYIAGINIQSAEISAFMQRLVVPCPFTSSLLSDCIKRHREKADLGIRYSLSGVCIIGATNAVDCMLNIKKLVYEQKRFTMEQVLQALRDNFEGHEIMRQIMLHQPVRFGNDIQEADEMANKVYAVHSEFDRAHADGRGGHYADGVWPVDLHVVYGEKTGASPDGRKNGDSLVDGVGAVQGVDRNGPTALLRSVASLNNVEHWAGGNTCNIKFSASSIKTQNALKNVGIMSDTFMRLGGQELQINVLDNETLLDAQEHPENYQDLVVRVAGYSAYFTRLSRAVQNEIISRNTQSAV